MPIYSPCNSNRTPLKFNDVFINLGQLTKEDCIIDLHCFNEKNLEGGDLSYHTIFNIENNKSEEIDFLNPKLAEINQHCQDSAVQEEKTFTNNTYLNQNQNCFSNMYHVSNSPSNSSYTNSNLNVKFKLEKISPKNCNIDLIKKNIQDKLKKNPFKLWK